MSEDPRAFYQKKIDYLSLSKDNIRKAIVDLRVVIETEKKAPGVDEDYISDLIDIKDELCKIRNKIDFRIEEVSVMAKMYISK